VEWIEKIQPQGVPSLVGYSWAGLLAFETARQLAEKRGIACFTAMIGTMAPMRPTNFALRLTHFVRHFPSWMWHLITDQTHRWRRLMRWREMAKQTGRNLAKGRLPVEELVAESPLSRHLIGLMDKYRPPAGSQVAIRLFRESDGFHTLAHPLHAWQTNYLPDAGWNRWIDSPAPIHWIEGDHWTIIKPPAVTGVAQAIRAGMDQHMKRNAPPQRGS